ncbi:15023_t:CDS:10 [Entrophospora sp. SA101]|nr:15023_t:CDS:10 [Entrophospora sp. SA101]
MKNFFSGISCPEYDLVQERLNNWKKNSKERKKTWENAKENIEIRNQQLKLNLLKANKQVPEHQGQVDESELIIQRRNQQVNCKIDDVNYIDDIIDGINNDENIDVSTNQASPSIISIAAVDKADRTILLSTGRDVITVFRMWAVPNNMEFILDPNDRQMARVFTPTELEELRNMAKCHINLAIDKDLWDFVESFRIHNVCKYVRRPTIREYKNYCASKELNLDPDIDEQYHHKIYVVNAIQAFIRRVDIYGRNHIILSTSEDWWSANINNPLIEFCYFDQGNVVQSIPSRDRRNRENLMKVRVQSGNKPDFHLVESPQLMCGEIKKDDDLVTDQQNTGKLLQELSDELEFAFGSLPKDQQQIIMEIEATGYKIQKKRVGIYVMRVLGSGVYLGNEIDSFEIPTILQDIDKLIDGIQKVLTSKVRFEESVKRIEIGKKAVGSSFPRLASNLSVSNLPGKFIRATNHTPKRA